MDNYLFQKKEEEFWVRLFQKESDLKFKIKTSESPDSIIEYKSVDIGLEVANLYKNNTSNKGSRLKEQESFRNTILNSATEKYISESHRPIKLDVLFSPDFNTYKINQIQVSQTLFEFLSKINLREWENKRYSRSSDNWGNMSRYFSSIFVLGLPFKLENYWTPIDFGFKATITEKLLIEAKEKKEEKLINIYRKKVSKNWLLLVSDGRYQSSNFDHSKIKIAPIKSGFDKIFLLLYPYNIVQELKVY